MTDIYIFSDVLHGIDRKYGDLTGIPPEASLYSPEIWINLCKSAGSEAILIAAIGAKDIREENAISR